MFNNSNHTFTLYLHIYFIPPWTCTVTRQAHDPWGLQYVMCLKLSFLFNIGPPISTIYVPPPLLRCAGFVSYCFKLLFGMTVFFFLVNGMFLVSSCTSDCMYKHTE